jgi:hypothetical protein
VQNSNVATVSDPYKQLASNIPANTCGSYPQIPAKKNDTPLPSSNLWSGNKVLVGNTTICGDLQLTADVTITSSNALLVIQNGQLDTNGFTLKTSSGSSLTIIFSGDNSSGYTHAPTAVEPSTSPPRIPAPGRAWPFTRTRA